MMKAEIAREIIRSRTHVEKSVAARRPGPGLGVSLSGAGWETSGATSIAVQFYWIG